MFVYLLYAIILDYGLWLLARVFDYEGFVYVSNPIRTLFSYSLIMISAYGINKFIIDKISGLFFVAIFCLLIEPGLVYFMRGNVDYWQAFLLLGGYIWLLLFYKILNKIPFKIHSLHNKTIFYGIILAMTIFTYGSTIYYLGFKFNLDLSKVYEIRDYFMRNKTFLMGYLVIWQGNIINPLLFYYALEKNRYLFAAVIIIFQFYLFSVTGLKIFFFSLMFSYVVARYSKSLKLLIPALLSIIVVLSCFIYLYIGNVWFLALFVERTLFIPAQITYQYFEFFHNNPLIYLSDSVLKHIVEYPYLLPVPLTIGLRYYEGGSCNTGIFGNAYMNFGIPGVFLFVSLLAFILSIFDKIAASKEPNSSMIIASVAITLISIINSGLLTVMLTHGMLLALVLAFLI
jgi:hypothetical protein